MYSIGSEFNTQGQFEITSTNSSFQRSSFNSQRKGKSKGASDRFEDGISSNSYSGEEHVPGDEAQSIKQSIEKLFECIKKFLSSLASQIQGDKNAESTSEPESSDGASKSSCDKCFPKSDADKGRTESDHGNPCGKKSITDNLQSLFKMLSSLISKLVNSNQTDEFGDSSDISREPSEDSVKTIDTGGPDDTSARQPPVNISIAVSGTK
jgi:hypothetical protein